ncbi:hypothetical protein AAHC03_019220 [Spirometra sp. Aus1]
MWLFTNKPTASSISAGISSALGTGDEVLANYSICSDATDTSALAEFNGPHGVRWSLQIGVSRKTNDPVSVFTCTNFASLPVSVKETLAQTVKRMKTLRHPNILAWLDGTSLSLPLDPAQKLPSSFRIVTERVLPLEEYLRTQADKTNFNFFASWGIYQVARALVFLNDDCKLSHNAVGPGSVFVNRSGEWKLSRLDYVTSLADSVHQGGGSSYDAPSTPLQTPTGHCVDAWGLGCLIWAIFNPPSSGRLTDPSQLTSQASLQRIPRSLHRDYRRLLSAKLPLSAASKKSPVADFLKAGRSPTLAASGGFLANDYIDTLLFLEEIQIKEPQERHAFLVGLGDRVSMFPDDICRYKILPHLVNSLQFGAGGVDALVPVLGLTHLLSQADFDSVVLPGLVKLFASPDRATRVRLLDQLPRFVDNLPMKTVESQIFPSVATGFSDANPLVREATVRAMVHLAPSLPSKVLNDAVLRHLTHLQFKDEQGGIRANATVCLAKLACRMEPSIRRGPLLNAFLRATRDPFHPSRQAAATSLAASQGFYSAQELAGKVLPCLSFLTVDAEKEIRDIALRTLHAMLERLEKASEDPAVGEPDLTVVGKEGDASNQKGAVGILKSGTSAAGGLLGNWALSALTSFSNRLMTQSAAPQKPAVVLSTPAGDSSVPSDQRLDSTVSEQPSPSRNELKTDDRSKDLFKDDAEDEYDNWGSLEDLDLSESPSTAKKTLPKAGTPAISDWDTSDWADEKPKESSKREDWGIENKRQSESPSSTAVPSSNKASPKAPKVTTPGLNSVNSSRRNSEDTGGWNVGKGNDFSGKPSSSAALKLPAKVATPIASTDWTADWTNTQSVPAKNSSFTDNPDRFFDEFLPTTQKPANKPSLLSPSSKKAASRSVPKPATPKFQPASKRQDPGDDDWGAW